MDIDIKIEEVDSGYRNADAVFRQQMRELEQKQNTAIGIGRPKSIRKRRPKREFKVERRVLDPKPGEWELVSVETSEKTAIRLVSTGNENHDGYEYRIGE